ncbi:MAG: T9SS type A sorting domain-containing protein, partial [Bacteroidota bacterium]
DNIKGVQKIHWDSLNNQWEVAWVNSTVNMNGVLTYSQDADLLYGSGKELDCNYYYYGLDWNTGETLMKIPLGPEGTFVNDPYYDAGNNNIIDDTGNIYFPGGSSVIKVEIVERQTLSTESVTTDIPFQVFPNPTHDGFELPAEPDQSDELHIYDINGKKQQQWTQNGRYIQLHGFAPGLYLLEWQKGTTRQVAKFVVH